MQLRVSSCFASPSQNPEQSLSFDWLQVEFGCQQGYKIWVAADQECYSESGAEQ